jgi:SNF2 family DNA or RNA helicase
VIVAELYKVGRPIVVVQREGASDQGAWARLQAAMTRGIVDGGLNRVEVRADVFLAELNVLREIRNLFRLDIQLGPTLQAQLRELVSDRRGREQAVNSNEITDFQSLQTELASSGFKRPLKDFQKENLAAILRLPHGADFSVPGAGKTTVALANFALNRHRGLVDRLLVVGPIAAFQAWKDDGPECLSPAPKIVVYSGAGSLIPEATEILLINYNRLASDYDHIREFVAAKPTQIILDEAHRIKRGASGVHGRAVLDLAYAAKRRDVLTGTPAPQGAYDLVALMRFLYPGQDQQILPNVAYQEREGRNPDVLAATSSAISKYFVRTPKSRLELPGTKFNVVSEPMGAIQQAIYDALCGRLRESNFQDVSERREFARLGRIVMYLLEAATNPMLLLAGSDAEDEQGFAHPPLELDGSQSLIELLARYREFETPWKYIKVAEIVSNAAKNGQKVLVWSTFVRNLKALSKVLEKYQPAIVHGGIPFDENPLPGVITRQQEFERFRFDSKCSVLLANPAACGEGVSLHHWCHHAVYLDRTFNAGHFLQSQDRIHRLGLKKETLTEFTLLVSQRSIDESVDSRLRNKVSALAKLMNDPALVQIALPESDDDHGAPPVFVDDYSAVLSHVKSATKNAS